MTMKWIGGCSCGAVRYEAEGAPLRQAFCHCRECQRGSGSAFAAIAAFPFDKVRITQGTPTFYETERERGGKNGRGFCGLCGSRLFSGNDGVVMGIQAASLDDPSQFDPTAHAFMSHAQDWDPTKDSLPKHETYLPTAPEPTARP